jgi:hypothetical protein
LCCGKIPHKERKDFTTKTFVAKKRHHKYSLLTAGVSHKWKQTDTVSTRLFCQRSAQQQQAAAARLSFLA